MARGERPHAQGDRLRPQVADRHDRQPHHGGDCRHAGDLGEHVVGQPEREVEFTPGQSSSSTVFEAAQTAHSASTMPALRGVTPAKTRRGQDAGGGGNSARDDSASIASRPSASRTAGQRARDSAGGPASSSGASRSRDVLLPWIAGHSSLGPCAARRQCPPTNGAPGRHEGAGPAANADARRGSVPPRRGDRDPSAVPPESAVERRDAWSCRVRPIFTSATSR